MGHGSHVGFPISDKNINLVYDHPMNICVKFGSNLFCGFRKNDETAEQISTKLARNVHWMVHYQICVFGADLNSNMAARVHTVFSRFKCEKPTTDDGRLPMTKAHRPAR
jgi:hypothetical protein